MCHYVGAKWLWWVVCVCVYFSWVLLAVQVWKCVGGKRCVDLETQKEGKKSTPKGREAEVTSPVDSLIILISEVPDSARAFARPVIWYRCLCEVLQRSLCRKIFSEC